MTRKHDRELGLDRPITRRDFVYGSAVLVGGAMAGCSGDSDSGAAGTPESAARADDYGFDVGNDWYGPGGVGDYASSHGNTPGVIRAAHEIRAGLFDEPPQNAIDSGEEYDVVIVGGGFSGLSAAYHFRRLNPSGRALILDNHPVFGGEAKQNDFEVDGVRVTGPQGSNDFVVRPATGAPDDYFTALGIPRDLSYAEPGGSAAGMRIPTDNFGFMHWQEHLIDVAHHFGGSGVGLIHDMWGAGLSATPWAPEVQQAFTRARSLDVADYVVGEPGPWLDRMTMKEYYERIAGLPPEVTEYVDPILASIIGGGCDIMFA